MKRNTRGGFLLFPTRFPALKDAFLWLHINEIFRQKVQVG